MEPQVFIPPNEVITPETINWFPPSWLLSAILLGVFTIIIVSFISFIRYRQAYAVKRAALIELSQIQTQANLSDLQKLVLFNQLLKRLALHYYPQEQATITLLHSQAWSDWLQAKCQSSPNQQICGVWDALSRTLYLPESQLDNLGIETSVQSILFWSDKGLPKFNWLTLRLSKKGLL